MFIQVSLQNEDKRRDNVSDLLVPKKPTIVLAHLRLRSEISQSERHMLCTEYM